MVSYLIERIPTLRTDVRADSNFQFKRIATYCWLQFIVKAALNFVKSKFVCSQHIDGWLTVFAKVCRRSLGIFGDFRWISLTFGDLRRFATICDDLWRFEGKISKNSPWTCISSVAIVREILARILARIRARIGRFRVPRFGLCWMRSLVACERSLAERLIPLRWIGGGSAADHRAIGLCPRRVVFAHSKLTECGSRVAKIKTKNVCKF